MISKILFTMLVIVIVGIIFKSKNPAPAAPKKNITPQDNDETSLAPKTVAYLIIAVLIITSSVLYYFHWSDDNKLVSLRVINASGGISDYQAYQKNIHGRSFISIDKRQIQLADSDRLEIILQKQ